MFVQVLAEVIAQALAAPAPKQEFPPVSANGVRMPKQESAGAMLCTSIEAVKVPLAPLPTEAGMVLCARAASGRHDGSV